MNAKRAVLAVGTVLMLAACGAAPPTPSAAPAAATAAASPAAAPSSSAPPDTGTTDGSPFTCSTVVDSDDSTSPFKVVADGGSMTAQQAIAYLEALLIADEVDLSAGNVSTTAATVLDGVEMDLENYHLDKLADDAQQFADDEQSYDPDGPVDTSYWSALQSDILTLGKDCPKALGEAYQIDHGSS